MCPSCALRVKRVQIVEALCMRARPPKQVQLVIDVAQGHARSWHWTVANDRDLRPDFHVQVDHEQVIQALSPIPPAKDVQILLDKA